MQNDLNDSKQVEFFSQGVAAWFNSALEHDKSLLSLSVAGIGFLISIMQVSVDSVFTLVIYVSAIFSFLVCIVSILMIFKRNKKHILDVFSGETDDDSILNILDSTASFSFLTAMLLSAILGIFSAITTYIDRGNKMANDSTNKITQPVATFDSVNGFSKLITTNESFSGMAGLQAVFQFQTQNNPQVSQPMTSQTQSAPAPVQSNSSDLISK